jgi:hypothetical protein
MADGVLLATDGAFCSEGIVGETINLITKTARVIRIPTRSCDSTIIPVVLV